MGHHRERHTSVTRVSAAQPPLGAGLAAGTARLRPVEIVPAAVALGIFLLVSIAALRAPWVADVGLAYQGGQLAWQTGHPEQLLTWISTPFLALVMALVSIAVYTPTTTLTPDKLDAIRPLQTLAAAQTILNCALMVAVLAWVWRKLRPVVSLTFWWATLLAAVAFAPVASTIFWRQFNLFALIAALGGFALVGRRDRSAGLLVALSLAIKPLLILLPLALLWKRDSRRAGIWALAWGTGLLAISQAFLAVRARDWHALSPVGDLQAFTSRSLPGSTGWVCSDENFSPQGTWCRLTASRTFNLTGGEYWSAKRLGLTVAVVVLVLLCAELLRPQSGRSWWILGFAAALSPLLSPLAWSHYQVLLAPLMLLLAYEFWRARAPLLPWATLATGYVLCELTLRPYGTLPGLARWFVTGTPESFGSMANVLAVAQFAQYFVLLAGILWFVHRNSAPAMAV
jgi:Glycosyltransferase family 87